jgi:hypothetical protein
LDGQAWLAGWAGRAGRRAGRAGAQAWASLDGEGGRSGGGGDLVPGADLKARPIFHHEREAIEAQLTVVFAALAVGRHLQQRSGVTIKKFVQTLRTVRSATIDINGQRMTLDPDLTGPASIILDRLNTGH